MDPEWGTVEYYRYMMRYWLKESERLRRSYNAGRQRHLDAGRDPYNWDTDITANGILADQRAARSEATKYATVLAGEAAYQSLVRTGTAVNSRS